jgi:hypothetical protein
LIASLPSLPLHFEVERDLISRPRLELRLRMLEEDDAAVIDQWTGFVVWDRQPLERTDEEVIATYETLMKEISNTTLREIIQMRIDTRTIISAVRRKRAGMPAPIGVGQWVDHIKRNFSEQDFNLAGRFPWIGEFTNLLAAGDAMGAQRLLFGTNYRQWSRMAERFTFSFEAILLYLARWEIIDRWTSRNSEAGRARFESNLKEALGVHAQLFQ